MRVRALAATVVLPLGLLGLAACGSDDDASLTVRTEAPATDTEAPTTTRRTTATTESDTTMDDDTTTTSSRRTTTTSSGGSTSTSGGASSSPGGPTQTYPAAIRQVLVQTFEGQGVTADQANCVVGVFEQRVPYDKLISGDISAIMEDAAGFGAQMQQDCGVDPTDLAGVGATPSTTG